MILLNGVEVQFKTFPNGETMLVTEGLEENIHTIDIVSFKYQNDGDLIKLMFLKKYLDDNFPGDIYLTIYYMPYSRMDRVEGSNAFTLKYVSQFINSLNFDSVEIIEPHSDVTPALVDKSTSLMVNFGLIKDVMDEVEFIPQIDYLVYPDAGAAKRYAKLGDFNTLIGHKERDFETGRIKSLELLGKHNKIGRQKAIIVDDLSSYGGTFLLTANHLKEMGFKEIYLLVAHAEDNIFKGKIFEEGSPIDKVFTTDSIISKPLVWTNKQYEDKIHIFDIEELINE